MNIYRMIRKRRHKKLRKAIEVLHKEHMRHKSAGHKALFEGVNESRVVLICDNCPELQPMGRSSEE